MSRRTLDGDQELGQHFEPNIATQRKVVASFLENPSQICTSATSCLDSFFLFVSRTVAPLWPCQYSFTHKPVF